MTRFTRLLALIAVVAFSGAVTTVLPGVSASATSGGCTESYGGSAAGDSWSATEPLRRWGLAVLGRLRRLGPTPP